MGIYGHRFDYLKESFGSSFESFGKGETNETKEKSHNESPLIRKAREMPDKITDPKELDKPIAKYVDIKEEAAILEASAKELKSNTIRTPIIVKNHIKYTIRVPQEIKEEGKRIADILKSEYSKLQNSKEFKDIVKDLKDSGKITAEDAKHKLTDELIYEVNDMSNAYVLNITLTSPMSQDMFYEKASNGKALYNLVDPLFNKLKSDNRIKGSKYFYFMNEGDDFYACDVMLKICDSKDIDNYLVEIKIK